MSGVPPGPPQHRLGHGPSEGLSLIAPISFPTREPCSLVSLVKLANIAGFFRYKDFMLQVPTSMKISKQIRDSEIATIKNKLAQSL